MFGLRRTRSTGDGREPAGEPDERHGSTAPGGKGPGGKGRPTPKRREAEQRRRSSSLAAAGDGRRLSRDEVRERRRTMRRALASGDERNLPPRDAGPVRRFARDYVDARRNLGGFFLPGAIVVFLFGFGPPVVRLAAYVGLYVLLLAIVVDSIVLARGLRRAARARFPDAELRGLAAYGIMRSLQMRRLRLPPPKVTRGTRAV